MGVYVSYAMVIYLKLFDSSKDVFPSLIFFEDRRIILWSH